jgi:uncharacterized integral membrane protein
MTYPPENRPPATPEAAELPLAPLPPELSGTGAGLEPVGAEPVGAEPEKRERAKVARTRISAVWVGIWAGVLVLILMIIFIAQNTASVQISFFALEGQISLALALLIAGVAGAIIAMAVGAFRILQLRREVRRRH